MDRKGRIIDGRVGLRRNNTEGCQRAAGGPPYTNSNPPQHSGMSFRSVTITFVYSPKFLKHKAEESAPASANDLTLPSLAPESMASYPEDFWTYYSQVEPSNAGAASSPEGSYAGPNHQDVEHLLNESRQRGEQIMWPKFHPNEFRTAVVVETPQHQA